MNSHSKRLASALLFEAFDPEGAGAGFLNHDGTRLVPGLLQRWAPVLCGSRCPAAFENSGLLRPFSHAVGVFVQRRAGSVAGPRRFSPAEARM